MEYITIFNAQTKTMTPFFRRIRHKLANDNQFLKYSRYAIGEIFLVVIGILIALYINNWNEQRRESNSEFLYYERILADFELDKALIDTLYQDADKRIKESKQLLLDLDSGTKDKYYVLNAFLTAFRSDVYVPRDVTFKDLVSSGNLNLLNDITIKNSLIQYYSELENILSQISQNRDVKVKLSFDIINENGFGMQEFDYVKAQLKPEIIQILPNENWIEDRSSETYKKFQNLILFNLTMADRDKQHLKKINSLMQVPYNLLKAKCEK